MRLIDADALCERIRKIYDGYMLDEGCTPIEFEIMVDEQQTAYDVEKVALELRHLAFRLPKDYCGLDGKDRAVMFDDAIDLVRKGGVE